MAADVMAQQLVQGGRPLDIPTADETAAAVDAKMRAFHAEQRDIEQARLRERARGKKRMEGLAIVSPAATTAFVGQPQGIGPDEGYVWSLKLVGVTLASAGTLVIYKASNSGDTRRPLASLASGTPQVATWSSDQARLRHGEGVYLVGGQNITAVYVTAWEVPAELEAEVYD